MHLAYFSDWIINSIQKDWFKDPIQQEMAGKIKTEIIEKSTQFKKSSNNENHNEINFTKRAFEISWNQSLREIYSIKDMHFRSISADIDSSNWCYRRFVEGKIVFDTWLSYPSRQSWIQSCHSLLKQMNETENYVWIIDTRKLISSQQSEIMLLAPCLHPVSKNINSSWIIGKNEYFPKSSAWWGNPIYHSVELEKAFSSIGLLATPEENTRWARRKRHWKRVINDWKIARTETKHMNNGNNWNEPIFNWENYSPEDQSNILKDLLCWLDPT